MSIKKYEKKKLFQMGKWQPWNRRMKTKDITHPSSGLERNGICKTREHKQKENCVEGGNYQERKRTVRKIWIMGTNENKDVDVCEYEYLCMSVSVCVHMWYDAIKCHNETHLLNTHEKNMKRTQKSFCLICHAERKIIWITSVLI